jgi:hypothetical protein
MRMCPECERLTRKLVQGRLPVSEWEACRLHAETCEECRQILDVHAALGAAGQDVVEPSEAEFRRMRQKVLVTIDARMRGRQCGSFGRDAWTFLRIHPVPAALALLIVVAGSALAGHWSGAPTRVDDELLRAIRRQTASTAGLDGYWDEPFACTNVSARPLPGGRLAVSLDVSRHVELVAARESDLAKGLLVNAILEPAPVGTRLKAMGLAEEIRGVRLEEALVFTLTHDPNLAVRLKAFEVLTRFPFDPSIQDALLTTLRQDTSVQMRLQALEYLARQQIGPDVLRRSIDEGAADGDPAIQQRAVELARKL